MEAQRRHTGTLAQRLGCGAGDRLLILHADDAGMCHSANAATIRAMTDGVVSSASVMTPCPWFPEIAAWARERPGMDLGVHLTLNSEWKWYRWRPVSPPDQVPGLVDGDGFLWRDVADVALRASAKEVETELRAQIERALRFGLRPTHLDSHMGAVFARLDFFEVYVSLSREYGLPAMIPAEAPAEVKREGVDPRVIRRLEALRGEGQPLLDRLVLGASGKSFEERKESFHAIIRGLEPGVTQLIVHLNGRDDEAASISDSWEQRYFEYLLCTSPETRELLRREGVKLIGYRPIAEVWAAERPAGREAR